MKIYTLGTDLRGEEDFVEILDHYGIGVLLDVRSFPRSRYPVFSRGRLDRLLRENGIDYLFMGRELGGFRKGGYESYAESEEFSAAVDRVQEVARAKAAVIVCAERFPWKCHRRWIARELHRRGWNVVHILDVDKTWEPK